MFRIARNADTTHRSRPTRRSAAVAVVMLSLTGAGALGALSPANAATKPKVTKPAVDPNAPEVLSPGDIPDNIAYVPYKSVTGGFSVTTPEGWSRKDTATGVVFTDKYNIIQIDTMTGAQAPTTASVTTAVRTKLATSKGFKLAKVTTVRRKAGSAVMASYVVNSAPNAVTGKTIPVAVERYEFHRNSTSVVLTLSGAKGADNVDPWKIVTDSFAWA